MRRMGKAVSEFLPAKVGLATSATVNATDLIWPAPQNWSGLKRETAGRLAHGGTHEKARTAEEITRLLKEADRDLAKGLTVSDICRKHGIGQSMYYRWRQKSDPDKVDTDHRCRELELEVDRLKKLVAELILDKPMLQDIAKKSGNPGPTASRRRLLERALWDLATADLSCLGAVSFGTAIPPEAPGRRTGIEPRDQTAGPSPSAVWISDGSCPPAAARVDNQHQTSSSSSGRSMSRFVGPAHRRASRGEVFTLTLRSHDRLDSLAHPWS